MNTSMKSVSNPRQKKNVPQEKGAIGVIKLSVHSDCHVRIVSGMQQRKDGDRGVTRPQPHGEL